METVMIILAGISLGLLVIYKSFVSAEEDPETFNGFDLAEKYKKPKGWKVGKLPKVMDAEVGKKKQISVNV